MSDQILVPLHTYPDGNALNIAGYARMIAQHLEADIHALVINVKFPPISSLLGNLLVDVPALVSTSKERCDKNGITLLNAMETEMTMHKVAWHSSKVECYPDNSGRAVTEIARYHDFIVVGLGSQDNVLQSITEPMIFETGKPAILVPEDKDVGSMTHVMIAWDGSRVAARAVADARPFLARATSVTIVSINDEKPLSDPSLGEHLADYLGSHGIKTHVMTAKTNDRPIAETLQAHAVEIGAGIIVMGGFGHSRIRDFILGGATEGILRNLKMPVLLSH